MNFRHIPVLLEETIEFLKCAPGKVYVDCTLGEGGHAAQILRAIQPGGRLLGIDRDEDALAVAGQRLKGSDQQAIFEMQDISNLASEASVILIHDNFRNLTEILAQQGIASADGFLFDLGLSGLQLTENSRGFSFKHDGPLDMRMDRRSKTAAANLINTLSYDKIVKIIWEYSQERWARRIARSICQQRVTKPITTTFQLVEVIKSAIPISARQRIHPATRTFQALRIAVNEELVTLKEALDQAVRLLNPGGRICCISFHSLEDRITKHTFGHLARSCQCPPELPVCVCSGKPIVRVITPSPITPSQAEVSCNPRARSAKLRVAEKL